MKIYSLGDECAAVIIAKQLKNKGLLIAAVGPT
jgi:hypothetical protein